MIGRLNHRLAMHWTRVGTRFMPFADAASKELPLGRLLRLSLFQVSVGMAVVLLNGTLNRVMIVELGVAAWLVAAMVSIPLLFAPFRVLVGHRSDTYRSSIGWRRVPFIWIGTWLQFGGLAIMPFALLILTGEAYGAMIWGQIGAALAFLLVGVGLHTTQTAGLALATDLSDESQRPRVVALLYVMLLAGMVISAVAFGQLLADFSYTRLVQVVQGAAVVTLAHNVVALWKQESLNPERTAHDKPRPTFRSAWRAFAAAGRPVRFLVAVALGTAAFSMQDILLEPYGGEILGLSVSATTMLTAILAIGTLAAFAFASRALGRGVDPLRLAAGGSLVGIAAFSAVVFADPLESVRLFQAGTALIGFGGGCFACGTLIAAMGLDRGDQAGLALGAWGAVQATAAGLAIAAGGFLRDVVGGLAANGALGITLAARPAVGYSVVYHLEILLLFATLVVIGPLVRSQRPDCQWRATRFGLADFPT
ncbi:MAG: BCD family MFS transporter [Gammaproteobacteria bacterium]|nr:BCD family MFS transporter [Gammaproteobacteria bacterium]